MNREQIVKLTNTEISEALWEMINQLLEGQAVDLKLLMQTPEMEAGEQFYQNHGADTVLLNQSMRRILQQGILQSLSMSGSYIGDEKGKAIYAGMVERERRADFVLALWPSKQSKELLQTLSKKAHAHLVDLEMIKEQIPEFNKGWGAAQVHDEAKMIMMQAFEDCLALGQNVVVACNNDSLVSAQKLIKLTKEVGYTINVHYLDMNPYKALGCVLDEFVCTGRYRTPESVLQYVGENGENLMEKFVTELRESGMIG